MVFSSLLFVFVFFALNLIVYFLVPERYRNIVLLLFSLVFYSWGGPKYLILLMGETFICWFTAKRIEEQKEKGKKNLMKSNLLIACVALLTLLGIFKYFTFFLRNIKAVTGFPSAIPNIVLPIGISFYTFQLLSYVIDVYRGEVKAQQAYWKLLLYSSLFHQCIAGPIVRYETVQNEIENRVITQEDVFYGVRRFSIGLAKKAILANSCASLADKLLPYTISELAKQSWLGLWIGIFFYTLQIYLDFSAYSDMAIGMGRMVGFHYLENFNYPYIAKSVQDFWRRWHISLSTFFRDYIYIPLGGNRCSFLKYVRNMFVVWFLTGMWHGASWNYILWGMYYFIFLIAERIFNLYIKKQKNKNLQAKAKKEKLDAKSVILKVLGHIYTILVIMVGWTIFRFEDIGTLWFVIRRMLGRGIPEILGSQVKTMLIENIFFILFAVIAVTPLGKWIREKMQGRQQEKAIIKLSNCIDLITPAAMLILSMLALVGASYNPFLYFQF